MAPLLILKEAIKKVPFLKYALGIVGVAAAIAIIKSFEIDNYHIPAISICVFLGLMLLLVIFSKIASSKDNALKYAGYVLIYVTVTIICAVSILFTTSIFFDFPKPFYDYPFFKQELVFKQNVDTILKDNGKNKLDNTSKIQKEPRKQINATSAKKAQTINGRLEISIQLKNSSEGYNSIKVNGKVAELLASSTPFNPRIFVASNSENAQLIEIIMKNGDTCIIKKIFDKEKEQYFPIRFVPDCKADDLYE